ncbi:MAG: peptidoglycan DD-metalloendopeptidase family protein [Bacteroidetes bacterium]|nr:peptidoglycan DD-metalloendopeptidase family protein [Bacteroidota bacterium]
MKRIYFTLILTIVTSSIFSQVEKPIYKTVADQFERAYNQSNYDSIFAMFSVDMQKALPIDKTNEFLTGLKSQVGKITHRAFVKYENLSYASYKTEFERGSFAVNISVDDKSKINGLFIKPFKPDNLPKIVRNKTNLILPFKGSWDVFWGGDTKELNYHVESEAQKNAFDFLIIDKSGKTYKTDGKTNEDFYAFGKEIIAPCDGEIVLVVDGVKDNIPSEMNLFDVGGNTVILKTGNNEYLVFCHFKHQSIKVKEGQKVVQGQLLGLCGNTGHSSEAHLHFHIQNVEDVNKATGVKCYFDSIIVNEKVQRDYSPVKNEKVSNVKK